MDLWSTKYAGAVSYLFREIGIFILSSESREICAKIMSWHAHSLIIKSIGDCRKYVYKTIVKHM